MLQWIAKTMLSGTKAPAVGAVIVITGARLSMTTWRVTPATYVAGLPLMSRLWLPALSVLRTAKR